MRIAVCEDNLFHRDLFLTMLNRYATEKSMPFEITPYPNGMNLIYDVEEGASFDTVFLDIFMEDLLGIDTARKLRAIGYRGRIVFLTASSDFALESYDVDADNYLLKPLSYAKLETVLDGMTQEVTPCIYQVCQRSAVTNLAFYEILYVESQNSKCVIHTVSGENYTAYKSLNTVEKELHDARFYRCHQSFLLNMDHVRTLDNEFLLTNGELIPIRQRGVKAAREVYLDYLASKNPRLRRW